MQVSEKRSAMREGNGSLVSMNGSHPGPSGRSTPYNVNDPAPGKLFVGGLSYRTSSEELREHFEMFGNVTDVLIMRDPVTQRSRGFGFIRFSEPSSVENVLKMPIHTLDGRKIHPKRPYKTKQIFVGGVSQDTSAYEVISYFSQFGKVEQAVMLMDRQTKRHRGFGFVTFEDEDVVDRVCEMCSHTIKNKKVECKRVQPKELAATNQLAVPQAQAQTAAVNCGNLFGADQPLDSYRYSPYPASAAAGSELSWNGSKRYDTLDLNNENDSLKDLSSPLETSGNKSNNLGKEKEPSRTISTNNSLVSEEANADNEDEFVFKVPKPKKQTKKRTSEANFEENTARRRSARIQIKKHTEIKNLSPNLDSVGRRRSVRIQIRRDTEIMEAPKSFSPCLNCTTNNRKTVLKEDLKDSPITRRSKIVLDILNNGTIKELEKLHTVGPKTAEKIVLVRQTKGKFKTVTDIAKMQNWSKKKLDNFMRDNCLMI